MKAANAMVTRKYQTDIRECERNTKETRARYCDCCCCVKSLIQCQRSIFYPAQLMVKSKKPTLPLYSLYHSVAFEPLKCVVICLSYMLAMYAGEAYTVHPWNVFVFHLAQRRVWIDDVAYRIRFADFDGFFWSLCSFQIELAKWYN